MDRYLEQEDDLSVAATKSCTAGAGILAGTQEQFRVRELSPDHERARLLIQAALHQQELAFVKKDGVVGQQKFVLQLRRCPHGVFLQLLPALGEAQVVELADAEVRP